MINDHLLPMLVRDRDNLDYWLTRHEREGAINNRSSQEMRLQLAYLNAAIARRLSQAE